MPELLKTYNPREVEQAIYRRWEESGLFNPDKLPLAKRRKPFTISMPPPNITGELHIGHMLGLTIQDLLIRYHRLRGEAALLVPGTDHAAIATQVVVERELRKEGVQRHEIGREKFLEHVWKWKEKYGRRIVEQTKRVGASADWSRERFTMDKGLTLAVNTAFKRLYDDGLIYRGERITNWCPACRTSISDLEVDHEDVPGKLWYIKYPLTDGSGHVTVATTRPETMLGDTAVAVHPGDARFASFAGKTVRLPITGHNIPIITDTKIDREFGTGAVKVTPAHDMLDYELGQTHRLPIVRIIGFDGRLLPAAGVEYCGLSVLEARQRVIEKLRGLNAIEKEEDHIHAVALCSRSKTVIEPLISKQWFVRVKPLAEKAVRAVRSGKIKIVPERFVKTYFQWMENIHDWNISRQIWWGHQLPVWYRTQNGREETRVSLTRPGPSWTQDTDTLDTWFSAGLWTFSTLGWPKNTADLRRYHPTDVLETAWDILFFWVARMIMFSLYFVKEVPFKTVYLHGLVLDEHGQKMSKSKGTGVDPLVMGDKYGTDALRMSLIVGNAPGQDFRLYEKKIEGYRNFANKLWNVSRFVLSNERPRGRVTAGSLADRWILGKSQQLIKNVTRGLDKLDFSAAGQNLYDFLWHDFADWYLEVSKVRKNVGLLYVVLDNYLRLLHPFMPFITEQLWSRLYPDRLLLVSAWPKPSPRLAEAAGQLFEKLQRTVVALRNFRLHSGLPAGASCSFVARSEADDARLLAALSGVRVQTVRRLTVDSRYGDLLIGEITFQIEKRYIERFESWRQKERVALESHIASIERKLNNERFAARAPSAVVTNEREKLATAKQRLLEL
ncbi:MAG: valine--tRNA ligase [Patescibacteria group bacterium]